MDGAGLDTIVVGAGVGVLLPDAGAGAVVAGAGAVATGAGAVVAGTVDAGVEAGTEGTGALPPDDGGGSTITGLPGLLVQGVFAGIGGTAPPEVGAGLTLPEAGAGVAPLAGGVGLPEAGDGVAPLTGAGGMLPDDAGGWLLAHGVFAGYTKPGKLGRPPPVPALAGAGEPRRLPTTDGIAAWFGILNPLTSKDASASEPMAIEMTARCAKMRVRFMTDDDGKRYWLQRGACPERKLLRSKLGGCCWEAGGSC